MTKEIKNFKIQKVKRIMKKIVFFIIAIMISGNVFAQSPEANKINKIFSSADTFWKEKVDTATDWGKWLMTTKPYWDQVVEAEKKNAVSLMNSTNDLPASPDDIFKKHSAEMAELYQVMKNITPPEELKTYHAMLVEQSMQATKITNDEQAHQAVAEAEKLSNDGEKELNEVFKRHGVPQNIIDGFLKG